MGLLEELAETVRQAEGQLTALYIMEADVMTLTLEMHNSPVSVPNMDYDELRKRIMMGALHIMGVPVRIGSIH